MAADKIRENRCKRTDVCTPTFHWYPNDNVPRYQCALTLKLTDVTESLNDA